MHVTLINPPTIASVTTYAQEAVPPLGLAYIAAAVKAGGHAVTVIDAVGSALEQHTLYPKAERSVLRGLTIEEIIRRVPDHTSLIGVSCMFSNAWCPTRDLLTNLREAFPRPAIVLGGEHATACDAHILNTCPAVDFCVLGEGEETIVALTQALEDGDDVRGVPGIAFRDKGATARTGAPGSGPQFVRSPKRKRIRSIGAIHEPDWEAFPIEAYVGGQYNHGVVRGRTMPILASRGCPYQCTFCSSPAMWTTLWMARSPGDVLAEMKKYIVKYRANDFAFYDLTAIIKREWIIQFCELLIAEKLDITWQLPSGTRSEAMDGKVCELLYRSGCRNANYAPESGSPAVLARIKKKVKLSRMIASMQAAARAGIEIKTNIILGFPGETLAEVLETYRFLAELAVIGVEAVSIFPFCPYPGTELYDELFSKGKVTLDDEYFLSLVYTDLGQIESYNDRFSSAELRALVMLGNLVFYGIQFGAHPKRLLQMVLQIWKREQASKVTNAIEPMRKRLDAYRRMKKDRAEEGVPSARA